MKKLMIFACAMLVCAMANAQVVKGTVGNGNYKDYWGQTTAAYGLDFNSDGNLEFKLDSGEYYGTMFANMSATYRDNDSTNVVTDGATTGWFKFLQLGDTINAASEFNGKGSASISTVFADDRYVGFRIGYSDGMHYGYAKINFHGTEVEWTEIYYNATAGAQIVVGEKEPEPSSVEDVKENKTVQVKKYMINGQLFIERDGITYDAQGRIVRR